MKNLKLALFGVLAALWLGACGGGSGSSEPADSSGAENLGAAVNTIFEGSSEGGVINRISVERLASLLIREARAQSATETACDHLNDPPNEVTTGASIEAGTYGTTTSPVTLSASDDCEDGGEYASFSVASYSLTCSDADNVATTVVMLNSSGVWRENLTTGNTEVYGEFNVQVGGETVSDIRCSFLISHPLENGGGGQFTGECQDSSGAAIEQASEATCT